MTKIWRLWQLMRRLLHLQFLCHQFERCSLFLSTQYDIPTDGLSLMFLPQRMVTFKYGHGVLMCLTLTFLCGAFSSCYDVDKWPHEDPTSTAVRYIGIVIRLFTGRFVIFCRHQEKKSWNSSYPFERKLTFPKNSFPAKESHPPEWSCCITLTGTSLTVHRVSTQPLLLR